MHQLWLVLHEKINPWIYNSICNFGQFRMPVQTKVCFKNNLFTIGFLKIRNSKNRILKRFQKIWISSWNTAQSGIPGRSWDEVVRFGARQFWLEPIQSHWNRPCFHHVTYIDTWCGFVWKWYWSKTFCLIHLF